MYAVTGSNLFGQWFSGNPIFTEFEVVTLKNKTHDFDLNKAKLQQINWSYNIFKLDNAFYTTGAWRGKENQVAKVNFPQGSEDVENFIVTGNDYSLILVNIKSHTFWIIDLETGNNVKKIALIETPIDTENVVKRTRSDSDIIKAVATNHTCLCLTAGGMVYSGILPSYLDTSHCIGNVCDIKCGYEHCILLTTAGRIYTWGNGRRLQLGHGDLSNLDSPTEVEALAGIKIIKISAGGWHSLALSEFGDLYAWGWNDTGQLGIKEEKGVSSYSVPTLVDIFDENGDIIDTNIKDIGCGSRHTAIILEDSTVWTAGCNKYGQLGFSPDIYLEINYFKKVFKCEQNCTLNCGPWTTVLLNS